MCVCMCVCVCIRVCVGNITCSYSITCTPPSQYSNYLNHITDHLLLIEDLLISSSS